MERKQNEDFSIVMENIRYSSPQQFFGTKILFAVKGTAEVSYEGNKVEITAGDMVFVNRNKRYVMTGNEDSMVITLSISSHFFALHYKKYFQSAFQFFSDEHNSGRDKANRQLRHTLSEMIIENYRDQENSDLVLQSSIYQIMLIMTRFFRKDVAEWSGTEASDERVTRIIQKIEERYRDPLTLSEVAEEEFISASYLSRYFKQMTGIGFLTYLNQVRLKHSMDDLLYTTDSLADIAHNNGFSTAKNYTAVFKAAYNQTPSEYRKEYQTEGKLHQEMEANPEEATSVMKSPAVLVELAQFLNEESQTNFVQDRAPIKEREIELEKRSDDVLGHEKHLIFIGELRELLNENVKKQLMLAKREIGVQSVMVRNLIHGTTLLPEVETDELISTSPVYANSDLALQFLKIQDISLFIRVDYREIVSDEETFFRRFDLFMQHALLVFGRTFVEKWQVLFQGSKNHTVPANELKRLYTRLRLLLKKRTRNLQIGCHVTYDERKDTIPKNQHWIFDEAQKIDFISYDADQNDVVDFKQISDKDFIKSQSYIIDKTRKLKHFLKKNHIDKPMHLNNWNTLTGNTRYTNGTFFRGALILRTVLQLSKEVQSLGFWINNELHEKMGDSRDILIDGLELFHFFNGKRPVYYAMMFKERLQGKVVAQGDDYIMTENEDAYQLILFNERRFNPQYSTDELFVQSRNKELHFHLTGLRKGNYQIRMFRFDNENGGLYRNWRRLNSYYGIDNEIIDYILHLSRPAIEMVDEYIENEWSFSAYLSINAIHFVEMRKIIE